MNSGILELPHYTEQSAEVRARLDQLKARPVSLSVRDVDKRFDTPQGSITALEGVSFDVHRREFLCVIGASGCGKSTLIRILAGLESPSSGEVLVDGKSVSGPGRDRGMVFQGYTLFPWLTVKRNVMFGLTMGGSTEANAESEALQWIDLVGLGGSADVYPNQLSGGMKQRVAIARALANQPRVLLMDEPFGALDSQTRGQMQSYLLQIWKQVDITIIFITHDLEEAVYLADRVLVLDRDPGRVSELVEVAVPRPRKVEQFMLPEFLAAKRHLEGLIHSHKGGEADDVLPMLRMTQVGDDIE